MKKITRKYLPLFWAIVMVFLSVPTSVTALDITSKSTNNITDISASIQDEVIPNDEYIADGSQTRIIEITALRGKNVKHFQFPDGTMQAIAFPTAIHEKDAAGEWQLIDSSISLKTVRGAEVYTTKDGVSSFASSVTNNAPLFTISENGYSIAVSLDNSTNHNLIHATDTVKRVNVSSAEPTKNIEWQSVEDAISSTISKSTIRYESVYPYTDIEYIVSQNAVKENIVIKSAGSAANYRFKYQMTGLIAVLNDNGSIALLDEKTKKLEYEIPSPYMYDANGDISRNVYYTLSEVAAGTYIISVIADEEWLSEEKRSYPVVIDPSISSSRAVWDTFVNSADPDETYGDWGVWVGPSYTGLARNNMPTLPSGATITSGKLHVYYYYQSGVTGSRTIGAYKMTKTWDEMNDSYNTLKNSYGSSLGISTTLLSTETATASSGITSSNPRMITFDVTSAVFSWYNGSANYGIALKHYSGTPQATNGANTGTIIINYETYSDYRMYYTITYKIPNGVYAIEKADTDVYVRNNTVDEIAWVFQEPLTSPPISSSNRDYLFKIAYRASTDDYVIRSMSNNAIIIYPSLGNNNAPVAGKLTISGSHATDSNLPTTYTWKMTTTSDGYDYIWYKEGGITYYMRSTSNEGGGPILGFTTNPNDAGTKWSFHKYNGSAIDGVSKISYSAVLMLGETFDYDVYMYSSTIGRNGPIIYSVSEPDYSPTDKATIDSTTGVLNTLKGGLVRVKWTYSGSPLIWSRLVNISFEDKIIHTLNNKSTDKLMLPESSGSSSNIILDSYGRSKTAMMWKFEYAGNGYYKIKNDITGYYLMAPSNNTNNAKITQSTYNSTYGLWMIQRTSDGYYTLQSKNQYERTTSSPLYLSVSNNYIVQSSDTSNYKWSIDPLIMRINVLYDASFKDSYSNYLDLLKAIYSDNSVGNSIASVFKDRFGITLRVTYTTETYESFPYIENCAHKSSIETICKDCKNAGSDIDAVECRADLHHKSELSLLGTIPYSYLYSSTYTNILFTAYKGCYGVVERKNDGSIDEDKTYHQDAPYANGWTTSDCNRIIIMAYTQRSNLPNNNVDGIMRTTAHETLHTFGVSHCDTSNPCIMNSQASSVSQNLTMCATCQNKVNNNKFWLYGHE